MRCDLCERRFRHKFEIKSHICNQDTLRLVRREKLVNLEYLTKEYFELGKSAKEIADSLSNSDPSITAGWIINRLKKLGLETRTIKESTNSKRVRDKAKETNLERYGYSHNFNKDCSSRQKWEARLLNEEGITNVFQRDDVKAKVASWIAENGKTYSGRISYWHKLVMGILQEWEVQYACEMAIPFKENYRYYDVAVEDLIIEVNGDTLHGNPLKYKPSDVLCNFGTECSVESKWIKDLEKLDLAESKGFRVLVLWATDIRDRNIEVREKLKVAIYGDKESKDKVCQESTQYLRPL